MVGTSLEWVAMKRKTANTTARRRILLLADFAYASARAVAAGAVRFVSSRPGMELLISGGHPDNKDPEYSPPRGVDGIITCESAGTEELTRVLKVNPCRPVVFASVVREQTARRPKRHAVVLCDNAAVAHAAADLLLRQGLSTFGYVGTRLRQESHSWDRQRREAFVEMLGRRGFHVHVYVPPQRPASVNADWSALAVWLRGLPKPCGLFVSYDMRAMHVLNVCRAEGIAVPEQIQIVGADNEGWICEHTSPTLSSIEPDFEGCGILAAETVLAMMKGDRWEPERTFGVRRVERRMSTADVHGSANRALHARKLLRDLMCEPVSSETIASQLGCSRRMLQISYKAVFGRSIQEDLVEMRFEQTKRMLSESDVPICEIPECVGFSSPDHLMRLFKKRTGMTMLQWRRANR